MSWDISLEIDTGGVEPAEVVDIGNYTYNVMPMYAKVMGLRSLNSDLHGMLAGEAIPILRNGIAYMEDNPLIFQRMNPENGWGDYEGALEYLRKILKACVSNPKCTIRVS